MTIWRMTKKRFKNTKGWLRKHLDGSDDIEFADNEVLELYNLYNPFLEPLKITGFDLLDEWHKLV